MWGPAPLKEDILKMQGLILQAEREWAPRELKVRDKRGHRGEPRVEPWSHVLRRRRAPGVTGGGPLEK